MSSLVVERWECRTVSEVQTRENLRALYSQMDKWLWGDHYLHRGLLSQDNSSLGRELAGTENAIEDLAERFEFRTVGMFFTYRLP